MISLVLVVDFAAIVVALDGLVVNEVVAVVCVAVIGDAAVGVVELTIVVSNVSAAVVVVD